MEKKELKKYFIIALLIIGICAVVKNFAFFGYAIGLIFNALHPLILGAAIAYVFNIFLSFCEKHYFPKAKTGFLAYSRRAVCLTFSIVVTLGTIALLMKVVLPEFFKSISLIWEKIPPIAEDIKDWAIENSSELPDIQKEIQKFDIDWSSFTKTAVSFITSGAGGLISAVADVMSAITLTLTRWVIAIIFAVYLLICKDGIKKGLLRAESVYFKPEKQKKINHILDTANQKFRAFFVGQFTEAIILGSLCAIGMFVLKLDYAAMTGAVVGVTALIPIVGAYIGAALGAFMLLTEDPTQALVFIIFLVILQQIEGNFIYPKVVGSSIGLPGIWVLAAVTVGGSLFGILGMLLGVPIAATVYKLVNEDIDNREIALHPELAVKKVPEKTEKKKFSFKLPDKKNKTKKTNKK